LFIFKKIIDRSWIGAVFFAGALLATGTRGAFVTLVVGVVVVLLEMRTELLLSKKKMGFLLMVLGMFVSVMVLQDFGGSRSRFLGYHLEAGLTQRLLTIKLAGLMFIDNIITGVGYTGFRHLALDYGAWNEFSSRLYFSQNYIATAGNQFLQAATDGGILGLISFGYMVIVLLRTLKKAARNTVNENRNIFFAGYVWLLSLLIGNLTAAWLLPSSLISYVLWIILGFALLSEKKLPIPNRYSVVSGLHSKLVRTQA
jgi:O-antigen ligase